MLMTQYMINAKLDSPHKVDQEAKSDPDFAFTCTPGHTLIALPDQALVAGSFHTFYSTKYTVL